MGDPMKIRASCGRRFDRGQGAHEPRNGKSGQRKDAQGQTIPAWFIQHVTVTCNDKTVLSAQWGTAVSKNPFLSFKFKGGAKGDKITVTWTDSRGDTRTDVASVA